MTARKPKKPAKSKAHANGNTPEANGSAKPDACDHDGSRGPGRPTIYTKELGAEICQRVALREPLVKICADPRMPCESTIYVWKQKHPDFMDKYARAREHRADARSDRIDEICEELHAGKIDSNAARVLIDAEKWQAGKELPKR